MAFWFDLLTCIYVDMPTYSEVNRMRDQLFGGIDEDDGLDKAFEAMQSMRGNLQHKIQFTSLFTIIY